MTGHPPTLPRTATPETPAQPESVAARVRALAGAVVNLCATCREPLCGCRDDQWKPPARAVQPSSGAGNLGGDAHPPFCGVAPAFVETYRIITEQQ